VRPRAGRLRDVVYLLHLAISRGARGPAVGFGVHVRDDIQVWEVRLIRERLAAVNLDWALPPYPAARQGDAPGPLAVRVRLGPRGVAGP
jgi:hypothetical protein